MALTPTTAAQAGQMAAAITELNQLISDFQAAITAGAQITGAQITLLTGQVMTEVGQFNAADSATILNAIIAVAQANVTSLTTQLAAM